MTRPITVITAIKQAVLRNTLVAAHEKISEIEAMIVEIRAENVELRNTVAAQGITIAKTASHLKKYNNHNMSTSTGSGFNDRRNKFRCKRGSRGSDGAKPAGGNGGDQAENGQESICNRSPQNDHSKLILRYGVDMCPCYGGRIVKKYAIYKRVSDLDGNKRRVDATAVWEGWCELCGAEARAPMPFLDGTSLGLVTLGIITELYSYGITDANISGFLESAFRLRISESTVANARRAVLGAQDGQLALIKQAFWKLEFVHMDEIGFKIGVTGRTGYVWVATVRTRSGQCSYRAGRGPSCPNISDGCWTNRWWPTVSGPTSRIFRSCNGAGGTSWP